MGNCSFFLLSKDEIEATQRTDGSFSYAPDSRIERYYRKDGTYATCRTHNSPGYYDPSRVKKCTGCPARYHEWDNKHCTRCHVTYSFGNTDHCCVCRNRYYRNEVAHCDVCHNEYPMIGNYSCKNCQNEALNPLNIRGKTKTQSLPFKSIANDDTKVFVMAGEQPFGT